MGFTELLSQANIYLEAGELRSAIPILEEIIKRFSHVEGEGGATLETPYFFLGRAYFEAFRDGGDGRDAEKALMNFQKLEDKYPDSKFIKEIHLVRVDLHYHNEKIDSALKTMEALLKPPLRKLLTQPESMRILRQIARLHYQRKTAVEGVEVFKQLAIASDNDEDSALAAAGLLEYYLDRENLQEVRNQLPALAKETRMRYSPQLNVTLLQKADDLVARGEFRGASLLLNLVVSTEDIIAYYDRLQNRRRAETERLKALGDRGGERQRELVKEIERTERTLANLREMPSIKKDIILRKARNFAATERLFEAYWNYFDLLADYPDSEQTEFFLYAAFANATKIELGEETLDLGRRYLKGFPEGEYYSDVAVLLLPLARELGLDEEFEEIALDFLDKRAEDPNAISVHAELAQFYIERKRYEDLITRFTGYKENQPDSLFIDGCYYWSGMSYIVRGMYDEAIAEFKVVMAEHTRSFYVEDTEFRLGVAYMGGQYFAEAEETLQSYINQYPRSFVLDQAWYFFAQVARSTSRPEAAMERFIKADALTREQVMHDECAFEVGFILEELGRYDEMAAHYERYIERFGDNGRPNEATLHLGQAYIYQRRAGDGMAIYSKRIQEVLNVVGAAAMEDIIRAYAIQYGDLEKRLRVTHEFLEKLQSDDAYRAELFASRPRLFDEFYKNPDFDQPLYQAIRNDPEMGTQVIGEPGRLDVHVNFYRQQLAALPGETPEQLFTRMYKSGKSDGVAVIQIRAAMGLDAAGVEIPELPHADEAMLASSSAAMAAFLGRVAANNGRTEEANNAWLFTVKNFPDDPGAIIAHRGLGDLREAEGNIEEAFLHLAQIEKGFPSAPVIPDVLIHASELLMGLQRYDEAREKLQYMMRVPMWRGEIHARALYKIGQSYRKEGLLAEAHGFMERVFLAYPTFGEIAARAYIEDAEILVALNQPEDARRTLEEAVNNTNLTVSEELAGELQTALQNL